MAKHADLGSVWERVGCPNARRAVQIGEYEVCARTIVKHDAPALLAEVERLRAERRESLAEMHALLLRLSRAEAVAEAALEARAAERATHLAKLSLPETIAALDRRRAADDALSVALDAWRGGEG